MKRILSKNMKRQLNIIELVNNSEEYDVKMLTAKFNVDTKTMKNDVREINQIIYPIELVRAASMTYYLKIPRQYSLDYIYCCFLKESTEFNLLELIFLDENYNYQQLAGKLFISVSSLRRMIVKINQELTKEGFKITSNPLKLEGNEDSIVNFLISYLREKYTVTDNFLNDFEQVMLSDMSTKLLIEKKLEVSFAYIEMSKWLFIVRINRIKNGNIRTDVDYSKPYEELLTLFTHTPHFKKKFKEVFKIDISRELIAQVIYVLFDSDFCSTIEELEDKTKKNSRIFAIVKAISSIINGLGDTLSIDSKDKNMLLTLYNVSIIYYGKSYVLNDNDRLFLEGIERKWPMFFNLLINYYKKHTDVLVEGQFFSFAFFFITAWTELAEFLAQSQKKMKVGLFYSTTETHLKFVKFELERLLPNILDINVLTYQSIKDVSSRDCDVILTNIYDLIVDMPIICLSRHISPNDIEKVSNFYHIWTIAREGVKGHSKM